MLVCTGFYSRTFNLLTTHTAKALMVVKRQASELAVDSAFMPTLSLTFRSTLSRLGRRGQVQLVSIHMDFAVMLANSPLFEEDSKAFWTDLMETLRRLACLEEVKLVFDSLGTSEDFVARHYTAMARASHVASSFKIYHRVMSKDSVGERWVNPIKVLELR